MMLTHNQIFEEGHFTEQTGDLKGSGQSQFRDLVGFKPFDPFLLKEDVAFRKREQPIDAVKQGGLSCAVGSNEADDLPLMDAKTDLAKGMKAAKGLGYGINL
jgi:hypothetical protein